MWFRNLLLICLLFVAIPAFSQQDVDFHLGAHLLPGVNVLKVKRDFRDPYLWVLAQNDRVYRVNSLTMAVDDYTETFAPYNKLNFVDIAGRSADTVYVATNAPEVIEYENGVFRTMDKTSGIQGTINSIGLDYRSAAAGFNPFALDIGTTTNFYIYNFRTETITSQTNQQGPNQVFEATYRTLAVSDVGDSYYDITKQFPVYNLTYFTAYGGAVQYNTPAFGDTVRTYYYITNGFSPWMDDYDDVDLLMQVWGTEKGLFQNQWDYSYYLWDATVGYLPGIKINKVTSIFGLLAFSSPGNQTTSKMERENLLVGTQNGFYFTNSYFNKFANGVHDLNTFTLDADIGNQVVNDVCVDATTYTPTLCEDAVWVAAANGLYFLKPDYGAYVNPQNYSAVNFVGQPAALSSLNLCQGDSTVAVINPSFYSGNSFQWFKDGQQLTSATKDSLVIKAAGSYYAVLYDPCSGLHVTSNSLQVKVINGPVFTFNYPAVMAGCGTNPDTLNVTYSPGYHYRWYTNNTLNGDTTSSLIVTQSGNYYVEVSACTNSWVPSGKVQVDMITPPTPNITAGQPLYCAEDTATLSANIPADTSYTITWFRNDTLVVAGNGLPTLKTLAAGSYTVTVTTHLAGCTQTSAAFDLTFVPGPVFASQFPPGYTSCGPVSLGVDVPPNSNEQFRWYTNGVLNGDTTATFNAEQSGIYYVQASTCAGSWVSANPIQVNVVNLPTPAITADKPVYCAGDNAVLTENVPLDPSYTIDWYQGSNLLTANTNQTFITTNVPGSYTVEVVNNVQDSDGSTCSQTSASQTISFSPIPTISIAAIPENSFCDGQTVLLSVDFNSGSLLWSTGETGASIKVTTSGTYKVTVTSDAGCQNDTSITVTFLPNPVFTVSDTSICVYKREPVTLTAPSGFAAYSWNGQTGGQTFTVTEPGIVSLTITDADGCQATQQIKVADVCPTVHIPNTFTPNGDGINDTWAVEGLDESATVKVFSRWGAQVYQSLGYASPWNGEYNGRKLPQGVYYYMITAKNNTQKLSGWVTIVY